MLGVEFIDRVVGPVDVGGEMRALGADESGRFGSDDWFLAGHAALLR